MIDVTCEVPIYEIDGAPPPKDGPPLDVRSHWNDRSWVVIETPNGEKLTVNAADLLAAIANATNTGRR